MTKHERLVGEERRRAEIEKGQLIYARTALMQRFDPDYRPNSGITPEERARRDAYRYRNASQILTERLIEEGHNHEA